MQVFQDVRVGLDVPWLVFHGTCQGVIISQLVGWGGIEVVEEHLASRSLRFRAITTRGFSSLSFSASKLCIRRCRVRVRGGSGGLFRGPSEIGDDSESGWLIVLW